MEESILISIKKLLGLDKDYTAFDTDIIIHINSVFMILNQMGVGPKDHCFKIQDDLNTWNQFLADDQDLDSVKSYIYLKVKLLFDPPLSSAVAEANKQMINELEFRLNAQVDK